MSTIDLPFLVSQYRAVEILDVLAEGPHTWSELRAWTRGARRPLTQTMRVLAVHGIVRRRTHPGTWDRHVPAAHYELTPNGCDLVAQLSRLEVWTELYEHYLMDR